MPITAPEGKPLAETRVEPEASIPPANRQISEKPKEKDESAAPPLPKETTETKVDDSPPKPKVKPGHYFGIKF